jgi:hypothetical protein
VGQSDCRLIVLGGFDAATSATNAIVTWNPVERRFELFPATLLAPRAEFGAVVLADGRVLIAGGVAAPGGPPLDTTELLSPISNTVTPGPPLNVARRWFGLSGKFGTSLALATGGFDGNGDMLDSVEFFDGQDWVLGAALPGPTAQHVHVPFGEEVYVTAGNFQQIALQVSPAGSNEIHEGDLRFRPAYAFVAGDRVIVAGGDTRSILIHDFSSMESRLATRFTAFRRGAHSFTPRGTDGVTFLAAGGHRLSDQDQPLNNLEVLVYEPVGAFGGPDVQVFPVDNVTLPVPFAGHIGFVDPSGATVLAGGVGSGVGPHSRRVVMVLTDEQTPAFACR